MLDSMVLAGCKTQKLSAESQEALGFSGVAPGMQRSHDQDAEHADAHGL